MNATKVAATPVKAAEPKVAAKVAASVPAPAKAGGNTIAVEQGDSLNSIAKRAGVSVAELRAANGLASDNIRVGQALNLPAKTAGARVASLDKTVTGSVTAAGPTTYVPPAASQAPKVEAAAPAAPEAPVVQAIVTEPKIESQETASVAPRSTGIDAFRWPVSGRVVKGFGDKVGSRRNDGVNISVPRGTPVKAAENGVVIYAGEGLKEFGKTVLVKHDNGLVTVYGNADDILVERGATVKRGQDIAKSGMTGETDVPVLHFEVRKDSSPVDPMKYLR